MSQHEISRVPSRCPFSSPNTEVLPSIRDHVVIEITERATDTSLTAVDQSVRNNPFAAILKKFSSTRAGGWEGGYQPRSVIWLIDWWRCQGRGALRYCPTWWSPQTSYPNARLQPNPGALNTGSVSGRGSLREGGMECGRRKGGDLPRV